MLYIVQEYDDICHDQYNYEDGHLNHAEEHFEREDSADIIEYDNGKETVIKSKRNNTKLI